MHKLEKQGGFVLLDFVDFHKLDFTRRALGVNLSSADVEKGRKHGGDHAHSCAEVTRPYLLHTIGEFRESNLVSKAIWPGILHSKFV